MRFKIATIRLPSGETRQVVMEREGGGAVDLTAESIRAALGYTPAKSSDIPKITQEAGESESLVMSQKAVTDLVHDALGENSGVEYEAVDSVEEMTDTSKQYVLSATGTIWAYGDFTEEQEAENKFVPGAAALNQRYGTSSISAADGLFVSDYMPVDLDAASPYVMRAYKSAGVGFDAGIANIRIHYFDSDKGLLGNKYLTGSGSTTRTKTYTDSNGCAYWHIDEMFASNGSDEVQKITDFDISDVAFVRVTLGINSTATAITADDVADVIIKFDADAKTVIESRWYDTGVTPSAGGGNYVDLLKKVNRNTSDISNNSARITTLETAAETLTVPEYWADAVEDCIGRIKALQAGKNCITFPFFSDNHHRLGYSGVMIAKIMKECHLPYCFYAGDSIDSGYIASEDVMIAQDKAFDEAMSYIPNGRFCRAVGNHDGYWAVSADEKHTYTREQVYELFLREESVAQNKHFGDDGTYYYVDDIASKTRFVVLNTNGGSVDSTQLAWLRDEALSFAESGWAVVFISHQPISNHYHALISNAAEVRAVVADYINGTDSNKADVVAWFSGHIHRDRVYTGAAANTTDDTEGDAMGFAQVTITSDHTGIAYDDATKHTVANDDQSHAVDFVTINRAARTVNLTRLGIGSDRRFTY